jgi:hypothetical protein
MSPERSERRGRLDLSLMGGRDKRMGSRGRDGSVGGANEAS